MAANMFRHPVHPQAIARVQAIKYLQRQPTYRRSFSADSKPEQEDRGGDEGSTLKKRLWDRVFENDKPLADLRKELKDHEIAINKAIKDHGITTNNAVKDREITINKAISNLSTRVETGFAEVRTQFAEVTQVSTDSAEVKTDLAGVRTDFAQLKRKISFMQWQIGLVGSAVVAFLGFAGYAIKRAMDAQVVASVGSEPATESKDASNEVKNKK